MSNGAVGEFSLFGRDLFGDAIKPRGRGPLAQRFEYPPFSVLDARSGEWQERKRAWLTLGIQGEVGRTGNTQSGKQTAGIWSGTGNAGALRLDVRLKERELQPGSGNHRSNYGGYATTYGGEAASTAVSVFDPVLCELAYRWFCPAGGQILDPFAGGSVRGVVAALLGFSYWGVDLRAEQIAANEAQARSICADSSLPSWSCGDALDLLDKAPGADFIFSCPPYGDLERYSDDPRDLSTMPYPAFLEALEAIVTLASVRLKTDSFFGLVVGDFRDKRGNLRGFVADTIKAAGRCGLSLYNEAALITPAGSLPVRIGKQFAVSRKLGKSHQNLLIFVKGDGRRAATRIGV